MTYILRKSLSIERPDFHLYHLCLLGYALEHSGTMQQILTKDQTQLAGSAVAGLLRS